jgi:hypothetical protein
VAGIMTSDNAGKKVRLAERTRDFDSMSGQDLGVNSGCRLHLLALVEVRID